MVVSDYFLIMLWWLGAIFLIILWLLGVLVGAVFEKKIMIALGIFE